MAQRFRNRFLRDSGVMGSIASTFPDGSLGPHEAIYGEPTQEQQRWHGEVVFLTNPLTYSASEDAILGLQGMPHVRVVGQRSGGGSGRLRVLRLLPGWRLTLSTALTFDRKGHCIEGQGIPVDVDVPFPADALDYAERL